MILAIKIISDGLSSLVTKKWWNQALTPLNVKLNFFNPSLKRKKRLFLRRKKNKKPLVIKMLRMPKTIFFNKEVHHTSCAVT